MERSKHLSTVLTISTGFLVLYLVLLYKKQQEHIWMIWFATAVAFTGLISPWLAGIIHNGWFWIAEKMGYIMSRIVLGISFIFFLIPLGGLSRIFRKDFMFLKKRESSYYKNRNHVFSSEDLVDPW